MDRLSGLLARIEALAKVDVDGARLSGDVTFLAHDEGEWHVGRARTHAEFREGEQMAIVSAFADSNPEGAAAKLLESMGTQLRATIGRHREALKKADAAAAQVEALLKP